jgi:hypothetical protein
MLGGAKYYADIEMKPSVQVVWLYCILGAGLTIVLYILGFIASRQYAVSKMHRVRYWKSIHAIRKAFIIKHPDAQKYMILPTMSSRPNISTGEYFTPYLFACLNIIFASIIFWFIYIAASINDNSIVFTERSFYVSIVVFMLYLLPVLLLLPRNCAYYVKQLYRAKRISFKNPYPIYNDTPQGKLVKEWKKNYLSKNHAAFVVLVVIEYVVFGIGNIYYYHYINLYFNILMYVSMLLTLFCCGIIYIYPYLSLKYVLWLCQNNVMPCIPSNNSEKCELKKSCERFDILKENIDYICTDVDG